MSWDIEGVRAVVRDVGIQGDALVVQKPVRSLDGPEAVAFVNCKRCEEGLCVDLERPAAAYVRAFAQEHSACEEGWMPDQSPDQREVGS